MRRGTLAIALVLAAGALAPAAAAAEPSVRVTVTTSRFDYADTTATASYAVTCARGAACPAPRATRDVDTRRREVRRPRLGFSAERSSAVAGAPEAVGVAVQEESVTVHLARPGALDVTLTGTAAAGADAVPVAGSASSGGQAAGRAVRWRVAKARPGEHTFSARFRVTTDPQRVGSYAVQATVLRTERTTALLEHAFGAQPAGRQVTRTSALTFAARVAPPYGPPRAHAHPWVAAKNTQGVADAFLGAVSMEAFGAYSASGSGPAGGVSMGDLRRLAPGAVGQEGLSGGIAMTYWGGGIEEKFTPDGVFAYDDEDALTGLGVALCAERATYGDGVTGGLLYDRDAVTQPAVADLGVTKGRRALPRDSRGRLRTRWTGQLLAGWSASATRSAADGDEPPTRLGEYVYGANVGLAVTGGDLDNREGDDTVYSTPATLRVPKGERISTVFAGASVLGEMEFTMRFDPARDGSSMTLRAGVEPGGYWLRTTGRGYALDWATHLGVVMTSVPADRDPVEDDSRVYALRVVPPGTRGLVYYAVPGHPVRTAVLQPGVWEVTGLAGELAVRAVTGPGTDACYSPV